MSTQVHACGRCYTGASFRTYVRFEVERCGTANLPSYGTYEFVVEDVDGRLIGIGQIRDRETFFRGTLA